MNRTFFICADGKKTALVGAGRLFGIAANRDGYTNIEKLKSVSPIRGNVRYKASPPPVFSHQEALGYKQNITEPNPRVSLRNTLRGNQKSER